MHRQASRLQQGAMRIYQQQFGAKRRPTTSSTLFKCPVPWQRHPFHIVPYASNCSLEICPLKTPFSTKQHSLPSRLITTARTFIKWLHQNTLTPSHPFSPPWFGSLDRHLGSPSGTQPTGVARTSTRHLVNTSFVTVFDLVCGLDETHVCSSF
jgi:hypothetical protein